MGKDLVKELRWTTNEFQSDCKLQDESYGKSNNRTLYDTNMKRIKENFLSIRAPLRKRYEDIVKEIELLRQDYDKDVLKIELELKKSLEFAICERERKKADSIMQHFASESESKRDF